MILFLYMFMLTTKGVTGVLKTFQIAAEKPLISVGHILSFIIQ